MSGVDVSQAITSSYGNIYSEERNGIVGTTNNIWSNIHITLYFVSEWRNFVEYKSMAIGTNNHFFVTGTGDYNGSGNNFTFTVNNDKLFAANTSIRIYKRN